MLNTLIHLGLRQYKGIISVVCRDVQHARESRERLGELAKQAGASWLPSEFWDRSGYVNWLRVDFLLRGEVRWDTGDIIWDCETAFHSGRTQNYEVTTWAGAPVANWPATFGILYENTFHQGSGELSLTSS